MPITPGPVSGSLAGLAQKRKIGRSFFPEHAQSLNFIPAAIVADVLLWLQERLMDPAEVSYSFAGPGPDAILLSMVAMGKTRDLVGEARDAAIQASIFAGTKSEQRFAETKTKEAQDALESLTKSFSGFKKLLESKLGAAGYKQVEPIVNRVEAQLARSFPKSINDVIVVGAKFGKDPDKNATEYRKAIDKLFEEAKALDDDLSDLGTAIANKSRTKR